MSEVAERSIPYNGSSSSTNSPFSVDAEATISRLSAYRNVRGVMILARDSSSRNTTPEGTNGDGGGGIVQASGAVFEGESGKKYARAVEAIAASVSSAVKECEEDDELALLRIRTIRHELIITAQEKWLLVVLQDPGQ